MNQLHVKKQGRTLTVFLNEHEQPMPIASAVEDPQGFPFTFTGPQSEEQVRARWPGRQLVFVEAAKAAQPQGEVVTDAEVEAFTQGKPLPQEPRVVPASKLVEQAPPPATLAPVEALANRLFTSWKELLDERRAGQASDQDVEAVGTFLINAFPELEEPLKALAAQPKEKKRFSL